MTYLLDTNIIVDYFRQKEPGVQLLSSVSGKGTIAISIITYAELIHGVQKAHNPEFERKRIELFLSDTQAQNFPIISATIEIFARIKHGLEQKGQVLDDFDLLIAANAIEHSCIFVTRNRKHFERIPGLTIHEN